MSTGSWPTSHQEYTKELLKGIEPFNEGLFAAVDEILDYIIQNKEWIVENNLLEVIQSNNSSESEFFLLNNLPYPIHDFYNPKKFQEILSYYKDNT